MRATCGEAAKRTSEIEFHEPQALHCPCQRGKSAPHSLHT
ncbi:Uncharacterised protein [Vibrio cholerae]|nr:Uncharacterised protein [Vibrio cholerae]